MYLLWTNDPYKMSVYVYPIFWFPHSLLIVTHPFEQPFLFLFFTKFQHLPLSSKPYIYSISLFHNYSHDSFHHKHLNYIISYKLIGKYFCGTPHLVHFPHLVKLQIINSHLFQKKCSNGPSCYFGIIETPDSWSG